MPLARQRNTSVMTMVSVGQPPERPRQIERAAIVHDIKNCVSALSSLSRNAVTRFADPEFQQDALTTLSRTVERMQQLLARLLVPDAEPARRPAEPIDLQALVLEATAGLAADRRITLVRRLEPVSPVYGDRDALLRVVENLTTNAAEAIDHRGMVAVSLREERGHAVISITDTGCGIPAKYQEHHLFTPFRSTKEGGWGVGLYQSRLAVERLHGTITVESVEGQGATFTVRLPMRTDVDSPSLESVR
jgi:signal transduction histidine kinase